MRLEDYIRVLQKRWWMIMLVAASAAVAAYIFSKLQTPLYRMRAEYSVSFNRLDSGAALIGADRIFNDYRNRVYSPDEMQAIANQLQIDKTGVGLMKHVRLQPQPNESKFIIEAEYFDVDTAQKLAGAVGDRLNAIVVERNRNLTGEDRLSLARTRSPDYVGRTPNTRINVLAGGILGLVLGVLLAYVLEYLDDTLKSAVDVERYADLPTIGSIPSATMHGGRGRPRLRAARASGIVTQASPRNRNE